MKKQLTENQKTNLDEIYNYLLNKKHIDIATESSETIFVEYRSLFNKICFKKYNIGTTLIARYYNSLGKTMKHSVVWHSIQNFKIYSKSVPEILDTYFELHPSARNRKNSGIELKYIYNTKLTKIQKSVSNLTEDQQIELLEMIELRKKSWAWKNKDRITIIEGC